MFILFYVTVAVDKDIRVLACEVYIMVVITGDRIKLTLTLRLLVQCLLVRNTSNGKRSRRSTLHFLLSLFYLHPSTLHVYGCAVPALATREPRLSFTKAQRKHSANIRWQRLLGITIVNPLAFAIFLAWHPTFWAFDDRLKRKVALEKPALKFGQPAKRILAHPSIS